MPILGITVPVHNPGNGRTVVLNRGTDVPREVVVLINRSDVWASEEDAAEAAAIAAELDAAEESEAVPEEVAPTEPSRSGAGSGREAWTAFAEAHGVSIDPEDKREDIIAKLADAGVIDE